MLDELWLPLERGSICHAGPPHYNPPPIYRELEKLIGEYRQMERMFDRSIKEAGGVRWGQESFYGGETVFRSQQGRNGIERLLERLKSLETVSDAPEHGW